MTFTEQQISDATGFDCGELFTSEDQVREYFTLENMRQMFTGFGQDGENPALELTEERLDAFAETVIEHRWHMASRTILINGTATAVPEGAVAYKYADPIDDARWIYDEDDARRIAQEDPQLIVNVEDV